MGAGGATGGVVPETGRTHAQRLVSRCRTNTPMIRRGAKGCWEKKIKAKKKVDEDQIVGGKPAVVGGRC